jgi:lipopolysaccharide transport system ATP-binding protein
MGRESVRGGRAIFRLSCLHLGRSAYVASAAIFKHQRTDGLEAESYHVLDRCIHFQVLQSEQDTMPRGLCLQPFEAELTDV